MYLFVNNYQDLQQIFNAISRDILFSTLLSYLRIIIIHYSPIFAEAFFRQRKSLHGITRFLRGTLDFDFRSGKQFGVAVEISRQFKRA